MVFKMNVTFRPKNKSDKAPLGLNAYWENPFWIFCLPRWNTWMLTGVSKKLEVTMLYDLLQMVKILILLTYIYLKYTLHKQILYIKLHIILEKYP